MQETKEVTVRRLVRHAAMYGTEFVYETGRQLGLEPTELAGLILHLKKLNPKWKPARDLFDELVSQLAAQEIPQKTIARKLGTSAPTVRLSLSRAAKKERNGQVQILGPDGDSFLFAAVERPPRERAVA